jgi:hypothetical protein
MSVPRYLMVARARLPFVANIYYELIIITKKTLRVLNKNGSIVV